MSNQIARNSQGSQNLYGPNKAAFDRLSLIKNIAQTAPAIPFGSQIKTITNVGTGLFLDRMNGVNMAIVNNIVDYTSAQNPATLPYYTISANTGIQNGTTLIYSKTDNVLSINATIPSGLAGLGGTTQDYTLGFRVFNADGTIAANYSVDEYKVVGDVPGNLPLDGSSRCITGVLRVNAGQCVGIYSTCNRGAAESLQLYYKDKMYTLASGTAFQTECVIDIQKM